MTWATVSSCSCFCWLYSASPSLAAKNIINLIFVLTIWWYPCIESSVVGKGCLTRHYDQCVLLAKLYYYIPCFILYSQGKFVCYSRCFLTSYFCIPVPYNEKNIFLRVLVIKCLVGLHRTIQLQLLKHYCSGHRLGLPWYWLVCLGHEQRSFCHFWDRNNTVLSHKSSEWSSVITGPGLNSSSPEAKNAAIFHGSAINFQRDTVHEVAKSWTWLNNWAPLLYDMFAPIVS